MKSSNYNRPHACQRMRTKKLKNRDVKYYNSKARADNDQNIPFMQMSFFMSQFLTFYKRQKHNKFLQRQEF